MIDEIALESIKLLYFNFYLDLSIKTKTKERKTNF